MKPPPFEYRKPESLKETVALLAEFGDDAKILAGGQSLVPMLNMRLVRPTCLIDINGLTNERYMSLTGNPLKIGCLVRHVDFEKPLGPTVGLPILARAVKDIASPAVRNQGTFCGTLCHGDPTAEWQLISVLLNAVVHAWGQAGKRDIKAERFFVDRNVTSLKPDELVTRVEMTIPPVNWGWGFAEINQRSGDPAIVSAAALMSLEAGRVETARIALGGIAATAMRFPEVERSIEGESPSEALWSAVGSDVASLVEPHTDLQATSEFRRHLSAELTVRVLRQAFHRSNPVT